MFFYFFAKFLPFFASKWAKTEEKQAKKTKIQFNQQKSCEELVLQVQKYNKGLLTSGVKTCLAVCFAQLVLQNKFTTIGKFLAS